MEELEFIATNKSSQFYQKGQAIYQEGAVAQGLHCVHQGKIKVTKTSGDHKEQIMRLVRHGDVLGFRALVMGDRYSNSAVALEDCVVCFVPRPDFLRLVQSNLQFANSLMQLLASSLGEAEERMMQLAYKPVRERLAKALLLLQRTFAEEPNAAQFSISLSREDVASLVGTAKETVSRLLSDFKDAGIIATKGSQITILDSARLLSIATLYD
ncbi:Crp/Fnr family transcriptional regulator [Hymenobacter ginkgonis]|nr:Crp/Fnr family transcriptional regulator [Hymenobacter ginkgonis]